jgi:hypothetical protein
MTKRARAAMPRMGNRVRPDKLGFGGWLGSQSAAKQDDIDIE